MQWLRQRLVACRARVKLLVIDACHAGCDKGIEKVSATPKQLAEPLKHTPGVIVLASCQAGEKSLIWDVKGQSLFSYWLNQGLKGHADKDDQPGVSVDEL